MPRLTDTIAAPATPAGTAALALIRISGPDTQRIAGALIGRLPPPRHATYFDCHDRAGMLLDDVVATWFAAPRSYTGEDVLELSCHGSPFIARRILEDLFARGCRPAEPGEFTQRAFLNGRMDLSQAEAVMDLIRARSERALALAHQQRRGALGRRMVPMVDSLLGTLARIEAYIDFPEEDLPPEDLKAVRAALDGLAAATGRLLATTHYGELLREGIRTVILGRPNVGKSSLLNRLLGRDRALVSAEPGTTRDFIEERINAGPHCLRIIDTAGLNPSPSPLEQRGMAMALERAAEADLLLVVLDATEPEAPLPPELAGRLGEPATVVVFNKADLAPELAIPPALAPLRPLPVSALTGLGMDSLIQRIVSRADSFQQDVGEEFVAISARHAHALTGAREALQESLQKLDSGGPVELIASDLRAVLAAYGEITGKVDNEQMLDHLFATFCIGK